MFYSVLYRVQEEEEKEEDIYGGSTDDEQEGTTNKGISHAEMQGLGSAMVDQFSTSQTVAYHKNFAL